MYCYSKDTMGQRLSTASTQRSDTVDVTIDYIHADEEGIEKMHSMYVTTDVFARVAEVGEISRQLKADAMYQEIFVTVDLGAGYKPSGVLQSTIVKERLRDVFKGVFIVMLDIKGDFYYSRDYWSHINWWKDLQAFVTNMGFVFRSNGKITCPVIKTIYPGEAYSQHHRMLKYNISINQLVFEGDQ